MIASPRYRLRFALLSCVLLWGCAGERGGPVRVESIRFFPSGARISLNRETAVIEIAVLDADGVQLRSMNVPEGDRREVTLSFPWTENARYQFRLRLADGRLISRTATAPKKSEYLAGLDLRLPYGARVPPDASSLVGTGACVDGGVEIESFANTPIRFSVRMTLPPDVEFRNTKKQWRRSSADGQTVVQAEGAVHVAFEKRVLLFRVQLPADRPGQYDVVVEGRFTGADGRTWTRKRKSALHAVAPSQIASLLRIVSVHMPTDAEGRYDPARRADHIVLPNEIARWIRRRLGFGAGFIDRFHPAAYQTLRVESKADKGLTLLLSSDIVNPKTGDSVPAFAAAPYLSPGEVAKTLAIVFIPPGETADVILPIFIRPDILLPGEYQRGIEAKLLGADTTVLSTTVPLFVIRRNVVAIGVTLTTCIVSVCAFVLLVALQRRIFARFNIRSLVLIALFATTTFVAVGLPLTIVTNIVSALLGPFAFIVTGIFAQVVYFLLLTALVVLIPRVGTIALATVVRYLLRSVMMGGLSPVDILYVGTSVLLKELAFYLAGLTRSGGKIMAHYPQAKGRVTALAGIAAGAAEALSLFVSICLMACLFRLYFAYWYIWAFVIVNGFFYTFVGVAWGLRLGHNLRKVTD
ncbi:MAG: hypothetical protein GXP25_22965 [Planctomycetes bacterium]|nr:hypothetical protein [Planctomycetota bacterium]